MAAAQSDSCVRVEVAAVREVADRFAADGPALAAAGQRHRAGLSFDGACAGRAYRAQGDALRAALDRLGEDLIRWSRAVNEIAATLRAGVGSYTEAERRCAARIG
ncbi:hypothetical protein [Mycobacterium sp. 1274756.6]|uniref:hypothetical protein n=1 Tax=Mycobacterium sp. 1274756.6 TaxID=1834076 RepID=UPI0007FF390B|nr:hypothetical protein [Mycobacterium sp. 1274756.6]OBJ73994.1 hypothetical protein A5643_02395 [Mycobacterium sp. 1274756.6]